MVGCVVGIVVGAPGMRIVQRAYRVWRQEDRQGEIREFLHVGGGDRAVLAHQALEGHDEVAEGEA